MYTLNPRQRKKPVLQKKKPKEKPLRKPQPQQRRKLQNPPKDLLILPYR